VREGVGERRKVEDEGLGGRVGDGWGAAEQDLRDRDGPDKDEEMSEQLGRGLAYVLSTPSSRPTFVNAATARSKWSRVWAADICTRMRAFPSGTTG
jgi:hypothetical protein